jgi:hypothetical protein
VRNQLIIALGLTLALGNGINAGQSGVIRREEPPRQGPDIERSTVNFAEAWRPRGTAGLTRVVGTVIDNRQVPVPDATVQLRNLDSGQIEQSTKSETDGSYVFELDEPGTFVVEMVLVDGYVVALSNAGALSRFETLQTVVRLPGRWDVATRHMIISQDVSSFFGMSAEKTMTAGTMQLAGDVPSTDPGIPVSPLR